MKKTVMFLALFLISMDANAFYTTLEDDIARLREGVYKQDGTVDQKEAYIEKITKIIKVEREKAYFRVASACIEDVKKLCSKQEKDSLDFIVRCLSDNKNFLSNSCNAGIKANFRDK